MMIVQVEIKKKIGIKRKVGIVVLLVIIAKKNNWNIIAIIIIEEIMMIDQIHQNYKYI